MQANACAGRVRFASASSTNRLSGEEMVEKIFKLKDETTGFHDPETGLKVVRDQQVKVGHEVGRLTMQAIQVGRLVEVKAETHPNQAKPRPGKGMKPDE
jgi:hypothetical protein